MSSCKLRTFRECRVKFKRLDGKLVEFTTLKAVQTQEQSKRKINAAFGRSSPRQNYTLWANAMKKIGLPHTRKEWEKT